MAIIALLAACTPSEGGGGGTDNQAPVAIAGATPPSGQAPLLVDFSPAGSFDPDGSIASYSWNFGDGSAVSTVPSPSHTYTTGGVFNATLTVTDDGGKPASAAVVVVVTPPGNFPPVSVITATTLAGKTPLTVDFDSASSSDLDGTIVGYEWNFGDGAIATTPTATHLYDIPGSYVVTLKVTDNNGAVDTDSTIVSVADNLAPTAAAVAAPTSGKAPLAVSFDASTSSDSDGNVVDWDWDFDDGNTGTGEVVVHTFTAVGTYDVVLTATDDNGATDTTTVTVQVNPPQAPVAVANATPDGTKAPLGVVFSSLGSTDNDGSIIGYSWDFGDGSPLSTSANPSHLYTSAGNFTATLTVTDDDFLSTTASVPVIVGPPNVPPTAVGSATPAVGKPVLNVNFSSAGSTDSDGTVVGYSWDFGDGSPLSTAANPSHSYSVLGSYSALLTVTDNDGAIKTVAVSVSVVPNQPPTAQPVATPRQGKEPLTVALTGGTSNDSDGTIVSYSWDFTTDGIEDSTDVDASYDYVTPGTYTASLTVTDEDGATDTGTVEITVNPNQPPTAVANADFQSGNAPFSVTFEGRDSLDAELEGTITYSWDFDDGSAPSTSATPTHVFQDIRDYNVTLTVTDDNGATDSDTIVIHALDPVVRVSPSGNDTTGDGTIAAPYATIQAGIDGAVTQVKTIVKVAGGTYSGFTAANGVSVIGGFDQDFVANGPTGSNTVTVNGGAGAVAATISNLSLPITIKDLTLNGGGGSHATGVLVVGSTVTFDGVTATSGTASGAGSSAYGIRAIDDSTISVIDSSITASGGVAGATGAPGTAGADGAAGGNGTNGNAAGGAPINTATPAVRSGGAGGQGVKCVAILVCVSALPGNPGVAGGLNDPRGGDAGGGGVDNVGGGGGGEGGVAAPAAAPGAGGVAAPGDTFVSGTGGPGGVALAGPGGGGGGSGGSANNLLGAGNSGAGGAGGAGGAAGTGGAGGSGGGGSFAVYSSDSTVTIDGDTVLTTGAGGAGGTGGTGGKGGNGGAGGRGGGPSNSNPGAGGGAGGGGGGNGGGGGAGGNGGPSVGAYHSGTGTQTVEAPSVNELATIGASGTAGTAGTGGAIGTAGAGGGAGGLAGGTGTVVTGAKIGGAGQAGPVGIVGPSGAAGSTGLRRYSFDNGVVSNAMPVAVTQASATTGIAAHTVVFGSAGSYDPDGTITYSWDFGDGSALSTSAGPTHVYGSGTFVATLTVTDNDGAVATSTQTITVAVNELPAAIASATPEAGKAPLSVAFSSFGSIDTDGSIVTYSWNFGDGSPLSSSANPTHVYTANGNYDAVLTVTDNKGGQATAHVAVTVSPNNVAPTVTILANPAVGKAPTNVSLYSESSDSDGTVVSILWDFGDGSPTSTVQNPTHTYAVGVYTATFTATDNDGAVTTKSVLIRSLPNIAPAAVASASPNDGRAPVSTTLSSAGSVDFDGSIVSYSWSFGDGSPVSTSANPTHVYAAGTWTATLTVTDDDGVIGTATTVIHSTVNQAPVAVANGTLNGTKAPLVVDFSSAGSVDNDCGYLGGVCPGLTYKWDFGDGSPVSTDANPSHTYATPGLRTATLTVTDSEGATDVKTVSVTVGPFNVAPVAAGTATPTDGRAPLSVAFDSAGTSDSDGTVVGYSWDFGDGSPQESTSTAAHTYAGGTWTATLTVTDNDGATHTKAFTIHSTVNVAPTAAASGTPTTGLAPLSVAFSSAGSVDGDCALGGACPGLSYSWDFGDGSPADTSENPTHVYAAGHYTATLTVTDNEGGVGTATVAIFANVVPTADAQADVTSGDGPLAVQFTGSGSSDVDGTIASYSWDFGDGSPVDTSADPSHTYAPGVYTATLTVTDNSGVASTDTVVIDVNDKPTSSITSDIASGAGPLTVNFSGTAEDSDGTFSFVWDFGDSTSNNSDLAPSHVYTDPGIYNVTLTVTDDRGSVAVSSVRTITVT